MLLLTVAIVMAAMVLGSVVPAFADKGGIRPTTYGQCNAIQEAGGLVIFDEAPTAREWNALFDPIPAKNPDDTDPTATCWNPEGPGHFDKPDK